jgi:glycerophosphoryl diester phosphodiesterase
MVRTEDDRVRRLLSHRLRGFAPVDSTLQAMKAALAAGVRHVEFDVRMTRDGALIAFHDPFFHAIDGSWQQVEDWDLEALRRQHHMQVATVEEMVACFAAGKTPHSWLHIDMKVAGQADELLGILEHAGLLAQTVLVSWIPEVLQEFHARAASLPVCFSHISFARAPSFYRVARFAAPGKGLRRAAAVLGPLAPHAAALLATARVDFCDDGDPHAEVAPGDRAGCNHAHVVPQLLTGRMLGLLKATEGFAALPGWCTDRALVERYHGLGIRVAVFTARTAAALERMLATGADIVYVDDARLFA